MSTQPDLIPEPSRPRPVVKDVDVLVAGSGPAGFAAALCAAREGAKTLLVERYGYLGGMMTGSLVTWVLGVADGEGNVKAKGITQELRERLEQHDGVTATNQHGGYNIDAEVFKWQAVEMLHEAGAQVLLHTLVCDPLMNADRVAGVFVESKTGREAIRAKAVIDCTADADVAMRAGCACDDQTHDVTLRVMLQGVDKAKVAAFEKAEPGRYAAAVEEAKGLNAGNLLGVGALHMKDVDVGSAAALTDAEVTTRRDAFRSLAYLKEHMPGYENARISETLHQIGVRLGRRIEGEYVVTHDDVVSSRHFDDGIARLGAYLLGYALYGVPGLDYDIPYRCLVPKAIDGLLVAGRCISCDYEAGNSLRLIVPCFATGQAAGVAAALAVEAGVPLRTVDVPKLRERLLAQGVHLG